MIPWLLLIIATLIVLCVAMYAELRQVASAARARESLAADELEAAETALRAALERLRRIEAELARRERRLCPAPGAAAPPSPRGGDRTRAIEMAAAGAAAVEIARALELPAGEVELLLAIQPSRST